MPTLQLTDDQADHLVEFLTYAKGHLMCDWVNACPSDRENDDEAREQDELRDWIDGKIDQVVDVSKLIKAAIAIQKGFSTRRKVAAEFGHDIDEIDRDRDWIGRGRKRVTFDINGEPRSFAVADELAKQASRLYRRI
ncbi:hypothetical protein [Rhizobium pisi]|uniref:hypothetical protein n=1 Tax=Rhizobium pisi TaxID=574561 RepID=UPI003D02AF5C